MVNRDSPSYEFFKLISESTKDLPLNLTDANGTIYIGLRETREFSDGSKTQEFISFDPTYINSKFDFYEQSELVARKDLPKCS